MGTLEIDGLTKSYGSRKALRGTSFDVRSGEIFGFVGSNGAGKSTTMRIVLGVLMPDAGEVRWAGRPVDHALRRRIGYMPEERGLYPKMKVGEQLVYLARLHGLSKAESVASMERWTSTLGVDERREDEVQKLSLGNQQRVQLAAALVHDPEILVLDEPFSGLDPVAVDVMSGVLRERADAGVPVLFSSHQLELVEALCDRVGIIAAGAMDAVGTVEELRSIGNPQWVVDVPGTSDASTPAWVPDDVRVVGRSGSRITFEPRTPGSEQTVLRAALAQGDVTEFARVRRPLTELYRDVVRVDADRPTDPTTATEASA
ncbi:ABC-2 type transport system ATP-binding protein [Paraoerskovia marina]|uniref:ABC-2 type transport system ATP-binding protein n=1 Tax=Paraoerskovia marina TaxID=545619 RepID=A0A1H1QGE0_9CELL|nr:ATP-binding cassette domain-containing protein [Paraoerskovia marina]SDS22568.1 ABC-2 type transport system ATP-binding protein [Paraoerskovia marina]